MKRKLAIDSEPTVDENAKPRNLDCPADFQIWLVDPLGVEEAQLVDTVRTEYITDAEDAAAKWAVGPWKVELRPGQMGHRKDWPAKGRPGMFYLYVRDDSGVAHPISPVYEYGANDITRAEALWLATRPDYDTGPGEWSDHLPRMCDLRGIHDDDLALAELKRKMQPLMRKLRRLARRVKRLKGGAS